MGLGVRVQKGDATGYAYVERLDWDAMKRAAETAAQIASGGGAPVPIQAVSRDLPKRYELDRVTLDVPGVDKRKLLERAAAAAHAFDPSIVKVEASFAEELREILVFTSDGTMAHDTQPLLRLGVRVIAERDGKPRPASLGLARSALRRWRRLPPNQAESRRSAWPLCRRRCARRAERLILRRPYKRPRG